MAASKKEQAEQNGREVGQDGNQKIDSMMERPKSSKVKEGEEDDSLKREKDDEGEEEKGTNKRAKKDEGARNVEGDAEKAKEPASNKKAEVLEPGSTEDAKSDDDGAFKVLERGHIFFFYRPKVQAADAVEKSGKAASSIDDVQNTHMLLIPQASESSAAPASSEQQKKVGESFNTQPSGTSGEKASKLGVGFRLVRLGKKRLPAPEEAIKTGAQPGGIGGDASETIWAVVSDVGPDPAGLVGSMGEQRYNTRTRGQRYVGPSRPAGRGWYALMLQETEPPSSRSVKLIYALSHPADMGNVQSELGLTISGSVAISMRNPTTASSGPGAPPVGLDDSAKVQMSKEEMQDTFGGDSKEGGTRYGRPEDVQLLDREGVELLLIRERAQSKSEGASKGAGEEQAEALQELAKADTKRLSTADVLAEINMSTEQHPPEALEGDWI